MLFNSIDFLIFFPIVVLIYLVIPKKVRCFWLLAASYYFYMCWNAKYALLLLLSTVVTWISGVLLRKFAKPVGKKAVLIGCLSLNIGILFFFKYFDFFLETVNRVLGAVHMQVLVNPFDIILPVGISFYTFQALGYTNDVYQGKQEPIRNFFKYALFVSFFPQLVAGPIERSTHFLRQVEEVEKIKVWNYKNVANGLTYMVWGFFVKMVVADRAAILVNTVFDKYYMYNSLALILAAVCFAVQIYGDFAGYSIIATGAAKVMGFDLMENFEAPYFSRSIKEFWRRWHISLSTWFKDYLYIPLGGNRKGKVRRYINLMITFVVSGLWHGASFTFIAWGFLHGLYQVIEDATKGIRDKINEKLHTKTDSFGYKLMQTVITFILVDIAWVFFRASGIKAAIHYLCRIVTEWDPWSLFNGSLYHLGLDRMEMNILILGLVLLMVVDMVRYKTGRTFSQIMEDQCIWFRWIVIWGLMAACIVFGVYGINFESSQFIYFQF